METLNIDIYVVTITGITELELVEIETMMQHYTNKMCWWSTMPPAATKSVNILAQRP